jgi:hypothetical protein
MVFFIDGLRLSQVEHQCMMHIISDAEKSILNRINAKIMRCKDRLIKRWTTKFLKDPDINSIPKDDNELLKIIFAHEDYKTFSQSEKKPSPLTNYDRYNERDRTNDPIVFFEGGIELDSISTQCILAFQPDVGNWILGAFLGRISKGRKLILQAYMPILKADPSVTTMPATEDGLINMIVARADYQRLGG